MENAKIAKEINDKIFDENKMNSYAQENNLKLHLITIDKLEGNKVFTSALIKRIFKTNDKEINLISDNILKNNFIILTMKTKFSKLEKSNPRFEEYRKKAKLRLANKIYNYYDLNLNQKYKVEINNKTLDRLKNSF